jgi:sirohydrochlorin cobaltochelatase
VKIREALEIWLEAGRYRIGQILIRKEQEGYALLHFEDAGRADLRRLTHFEAAREVARYDDDGKYRPLKSAPNLRHGWIMLLPDLARVHAALDELYPAALGTLLADERGEAPPVHFRETVNRQTGMYAIAARISDEGADSLIGDFCKSEGGCLKTILWKIDAGVTVTTLPSEKFQPESLPDGSLPLLCCEACNLLVAAARSAVRALLDRQAAPATPAAKQGPGT